MFEIPKINEPLNTEQLHFLEVFAKSCRRTIMEMLINSQSGHSGGSLSSIDFLSLLYAFIIGQTGEKVVVSIGHISPAVYATLAEMGWVSKPDLIEGFRQLNSIFEGHVSRHVPGVPYGTGPLGIGVSAASGFATAEKRRKTGQKVYCVMGDGEANEGMVYEMMNYSSKYRLNNLVLFVDYNRVQLTDRLDVVMPLDIPGIFRTAKWNVLEVDGHNYGELWSALGKANASKNAPTVIIGKTIMGKGVPLIEKDGLELKATWHGKPPSPKDADEILSLLSLSEDETVLLEMFRKTHVAYIPEEPFINEKSPPVIDPGKPHILEPGAIADCRSAWGNAILDLAERNESIIALTADVGVSVMLNPLRDAHPDKVIEVGIAEQQMVSAAGAMSLDGLVPFTSTYGAFMTSRPKDQARTNDINRTNVKMVATHCGLSVGEDGPTHQSIDDMGTLLGLFNTSLLEPADANQCDHIIRYIAKTYGNFFVRMGRHKFPTLTKEDGSVYYDASYVFQPGKADILRSGNDITLICTGSLTEAAYKAYEELKSQINIELIVISSLKPLDEETILASVRKTKRLITVEDHNVLSGYGNAIAAAIARKKLQVEIITMGVNEYQLSGKSAELYEAAGLGVEHIKKNLLKLTMS